MVSACSLQAFPKVQYGDTTAFGTGTTGYAVIVFLFFFSPTTSPCDTHIKPENVSTTLESSDPEVFNEDTVHLQIFHGNYAHGEIHLSVVIKHTKHYGQILLFQ
jgi:hypothetical protein